MKGREDENDAETEHGLGRQLRCTCISQSLVGCGRLFAISSEVGECRRRSVAHLEPVIASDLQLDGLNLQNPGSLGALFTPGAQFRNGMGGTLGLDFHLAVQSVADPAADSQFQGAATAAAAKSHPLDVPFDRQLPALQKRLNPLLATADEASLEGFGAVASAARHREQIVEELAQWR